MSRIARLFGVLAFATGGCNTGDDNGAGSAAVDAGPSANALGKVCRSAEPADCPADHSCVILSIGNATQGYCSPTCAGDLDCKSGFTGPATADPRCFTPSKSDACSILCQGPADCPDGLTCASAQGAPFKFCATPR
jgi:hypothetical protein